MNDHQNAAAIADAALAAWARAFRTLDPDAMAARYAERSLHFGGRARLYEGPAGVREYFRTLGTVASRDVRFEDLTALAVTDDVVHLAATAWFVMDGVARPPMRLTQTLVRDGDDWRVASHHASVRPAS